MNLVINNHIIDAELYDILLKLNMDTNGKYLKQIRVSGDNIAVSCPFHKDGQENHPSCFVYSRHDSEEVEFGVFQCFTCKTKGSLYKLVAQCLECSVEQAKQWLVEHFSHTIQEHTLQLTDIDLSKRHEQKQYLDESVLEPFRYIHPYIVNKRKISPEIVKKFSVGWNKETDSITFPVWDKHNHLVGITERSVNTKRFYNPSGVDLPVYLLNFVLNENITEVYVVESQIDALYLWTMGYPAIALIGTGGKKAYNQLKNSGIRIYHLCFDGDMAGRHGAIRFIKNMSENLFIDVVVLPEGKDVNDLSKEEFDSLEHIDSYDYGLGSNKSKV